MSRAKKKKPIKHAVILVNYKKWEDTVVCVNSIQKAKDQPHIIVVDNGSGNDSVSKLREHFPDLDIIASSENIGFSAGNNLGIKKALRLGAKVIYILNNDTEVDPNLFYKSYRYLVGKDRIAGGKIYYAKGYEFHPEQKGKGNVLWYAGGYMDWQSVIARHTGVDEIDRGQHDQTKDVDFITGCFIAVPKRVFNRVGLLDEPFFLYLEDMDFTLKVLKAGYQAKYNPNLIVYHRNSSATVAGSPLVDYYLTRNRFFIGRRYGSFRLQFALFREALFRNWGSPIRRAAFLDFLWGKMGNRNDKIFNIAAKMGR